MAQALGLDPFAVRRANLLAAPTFTQNDLMVNSYGLPECLENCLMEMRRNTDPCIAHINLHVVLLTGNL